MTRETQSLYSLNRGVISRYGLARADVKRIALAAETQTNWLPRVLGGMMLRPGMKYIGATHLNAQVRFLKFIFSTTDTALLEIGYDGYMRIWMNDQLLTRPAVATIAYGFLGAAWANWTNLDEAGASSTNPGGILTQIGTGTNRAIVEQQVTVAVGDRNIEHGIFIRVSKGPVKLRIGSTSGADDYMSETTLEQGDHNLSIVPTGNFYIRLFSSAKYAVTVDSLSISTGIVSIYTPLVAAALGNIRYDQSGDVIYLACESFAPYKIQRRGTRPNARSWSVVRYKPFDGPFEIENTGEITLTPSASKGDITITASKALFKSTHVGSLFSITSPGQNVSTTTTIAGTATSSIRVTGIAGGRSFSIIISGMATVGTTVVLQRSYDNATWVNVTGQSWNSTNNPVNTTYTDGLDNQIVYYRLNLSVQGGADSVTMQLISQSGTVRSVFEVTAFTSSTVVSARVVGQDLGSLSATAVWQQAKWSDAAGWPSSVCLHEGRLWWSGKNSIVGSVSDAYESFDETIVGDSAPINRTIGSGPVDTINWILSLKGLILGSQGTEYIARASSLEEPLTVTNFNLKGSSNQGSGSVGAVKVDKTGYFVNRASVKVFALDFDARTYDYGSNCAMELCPEIGYPSIVRMDFQRLPDTRLHCILSDGTVAMMIINQTEEVAAWIKITTNGYVEDVVVLPAATGNLDDQVYYVVRRTINGSTVRYLEKWAQEIDCRGDKQYCYLADAYVAYSGAATTTITGLGHLEGQQVVVWADGRDVGTIETTDPFTQTYTVSGGQITLATAASNVVVGLGYTASFKSAKLGSNMPGNSALNQQKKIGHVGLIMADVYRLGLKYGSSSDYLDDIPLNEHGTDVPSGVWTDYDEQMIEFPGTWTTDSRIYLQAQAPRPVHVLAVTMNEVQS